MSSKNSSSSAINNVLINVLIPVLILSYCSSGDNDPLTQSSSEKLWHLGPWTAMGIAILLPLIYGTISLIRQKKVETMSLIGLVGVILTGVVSVLVVSENGQIIPATPWLYGIKEGVIPLMLGLAVWVTRNRKESLFNAFILNPDIFDIPAIQKGIQKNHNQIAFYQLSLWGNKMLMTSFFFSSILNVALSWFLLSPILELPLKEQQVAYNQAVGSIMWWGFLIIGIPMLGVVFYVLSAFLKKLSQLSGLGKDQILLKR